MKKHFKYIIIPLYVFFIIIGVLTSYLLSRDTINLASNGVVSSEIENDKIITKYNGEWELYYNKLLIIDNIDIDNTKYDALIKLPNSWNNIKALDGKNLPLDGYASYRLKVNNLHDGDIIKIEKMPTNVNMNIYINKRLIGSVGNVSKNSINFNINYKNLDEYKVSYNEDIEIIVEVGYNLLGGMIESPSFTTTSFKDSMKEINKYCSFVLLFFFFGLFLVEIVSYFKIYDSTMYTVNSVTSILLLFLFSPTLNSIFASYNFFINPIIDNTLNFIFYSLFLFFIYQFISFTYYIKLNKIKIIINSIIIGINSLIFLLLTPLNLEYISYIFITILYISLLIKVSYFNKLYNDLNFTYYFTMLIFFSIVGLELSIMADFNNFYNLPSNNSSILYLFIIYLLYLSIYISFIIRTYKEASKSFQYELQNQNLTLLLLKDQIKPHFIFNSLNAIKTLYHEDLDKGDYALSLLSKHLRFNVNTIKTNLISFDKEIDNIYNFVELENLKVENKYNVIFNIDYQEFEVPILSIEPFVENAIKYSNVNNIEDGYIEISTYQDDNFIIVEINDNGVGFDINSIKEKSYGIKNAIERFKILLKANVEIKSEINKGTNIKITIPKGENYEDNYS